MTAQDRKKRERAERRQFIVSTARELAEAEGWEAVTTRRLADLIEYSQPVLYSHFEGKNAIVSAVALEGFRELAALLNSARRSAVSLDDQARVALRTYMEFAVGNPALYEAMFVLPVDLTFAQSPPVALQDAFDELSGALAALAGDHNVETFTEVVWSALHGMVQLSKAGRLRSGFNDQRLSTLEDMLFTLRA